MENREKKTRSRLGTACKIIGGLETAGYVIVWVYAFRLMGMIGEEIWALLLQLLVGIAPGLTLWAVGVLLDRQKEDRETLAEIKALLGGAADGGEEEEDEDLAELEARLETALEDSSEDGEPEEPPTEEKEEE